MAELHEIICFGREGFGCSLAWIAFVLVFFFAAILRRQCDDGALAGTGFNFMFALIGGFVVAAVLAIILNPIKWAILGGLAGVIVGGFIVGRFFDSNEE